MLPVVDAGTTRSSPQPFHPQTISTDWPRCVRIKTGELVLCKWISPMLNHVAEAAHAQQIFSGWMLIL